MQLWLPRNHPLFSSTDVRAPLFSLLFAALLLAGCADPVARALLSAPGVTVYVVPMMNPDGARRGYLRTNAAGANLNREWQTPKLDYSPEVFHVLREMRRTGMHFGLDVHGDEALPYNFISGGEGCPCWTQKMADQQKQWCDSYVPRSPPFSSLARQATFTHTHRPSLSLSLSLSPSLSLSLSLMPLSLLLSVNEVT